MTYFLEPRAALERWIPKNREYVLEAGVQSLTAMRDRQFNSLSLMLINSIFDGKLAYFMLNNYKLAYYLWDRS